MPEATMSEITRKSDAGKTQYRHIMVDMAEQIEALSRVATRGAERYDDRSWQLSTKPVAYLDACYRHLYAYNKGELLDSDSGQQHLIHAAWNLLALAWFTQKTIDTASKQD